MRHFAIWKYSLPNPWVRVKFTLDLPVGETFKALALQDGKPTAWFEVDPSQPLWTREFMWLATGTAIEYNETKPYDYLGTVEIDGYVGHLYRRVV